MKKASTLIAVLLVAALGCSKKEGDKPKPTTGTVPDTVDAAAGGGPGTAAGGSAGTAASGGALDVKDVGFATPESVLYLADQDLYLVSNINGQPTGVDDNGFISKLDGEGKVTELKWIDGAKEDVTLNAPKGMAVLNGTLYVADVTAVRMFDLATGAARGAVELQGATFVNDLAAASDRVYATDSGLTPDFKSSGTDAVYAIDAAGAVTKLAAGPELKGPNGVAVVDGQVWVVSFGDKKLYRVADGKPTDATDLPTGGLDGLEALPDGRLVITSWEGKAVYVGKPGAGFTALAEGVESPADLGYDRRRNRVAVPIFTGNAVRMIPVR